MLPIDYYSDASSIQLSEFETFNNGFEYFMPLIGSTEYLDHLESFDESINWITDDLTDCSISNNVQYHQKSAQKDKALAGKIIRLEVRNVLGQSISCSANEFIGKQYNDQIEKEIVKGIQRRGIYFINVYTEQGIYRNKISLD